MKFTKQSNRLIGRALDANLLISLAGYYNDEGVAPSIRSSAMESSARLEVDGNNYRVLEGDKTSVYATELEALKEMRDIERRVLTRPDIQECAAHSALFEVSRAMSTECESECPIHDEFAARDEFKAMVALLGEYTKALQAQREKLWAELLGN
jgi:hypothetical protein